MTPHRPRIAMAFVAASLACSAEEEFPQLDQPGNPVGPSRPAGTDAVLDFDGIDDYATTGTAGFPIMLAPQTVSLWARYANTEGTQIMVVLRADWESGLALGIGEGTVGAWNVYGPRSLAGAASPPAVDAWHHLAYVFDGATHTFYVDGAVAGTGTREPGHRTPYLGWLGTVDGTSQFYRGRIDEVRIWSTARTEEQIGLEMRGNAPAVDPALVAYWRFDGVEGARIADDSGRGNTVSLGEGDPQRMPALVATDRMLEK